MSSLSTVVLGGGEPYFFLSYARTPKEDPEDRRDPDEWVLKLYKDLRRNILQLTSAQPGEAGFMDREMRPGAEWPQSLAQALARCRVFVPLYSPRYFESETCGREWFAFARRAVDHAARQGASTHAIVPALWVGVNHSRLPEVARSIQTDHRAFGTRYSSEGFWGIMKLARYRDDYQMAVLQLAKRIVEVADQTNIAMADPADYQTLPSAFGHSSALGPEYRRIQFSIAALDIHSLPNGRRQFYYGPTTHHWNPYKPECRQPIAAYTTQLTGCLGYSSAIGTLDGLSRKSWHSAASPGLVLLDPWEVVSDDRRARLRQFDTHSEEWVSVMVAWNHEDDELREAEPELRKKISTSVKNMLSRIPASCRIAGEGIPTLSVFGDTLPKMIHAMIRRYLKSVPAYPPSGPFIERPHLAGPHLERPGETR